MEYNPDTVPASFSDVGASLQSLRDLHLPEAVSLWWPPAIGWFILATLIFCGIVMAVYYGFCTWERRRLRREAMKCLRDIELQCVDENDQYFATQCASIIRRVAIAYFKRENVASLHGDAWFEFLSRYDRKNYYHEQFDVLIRAPYEWHVVIDRQALLKACLEWVKQLPLTKYSEKQCLN